MRKILLFLFFLFSYLSYSQNDTIIKGKIVSDLTDLEGIHVINRSKQKGTVTARGGYFEIYANTNDSIIFSSVNLKGITYLVKKDDFEKELLFIPMESMLNELQEITITEYKNINAEALGIIPKGMKTYTPAERRLKSAEKLKWYSPLLIPLGGMSVDGLINQISGKTSRLKKELKVEHKERFLELLSEDYNDAFVINELKIPQDYVDGFRHFIVDDKRLIESIKNKNNVQTVFILNQLAAQYKELNNL